MFGLIMKSETRPVITYMGEIHQVLRSLTACLDGSAKKNTQESLIFQGADPPTSLQAPP
jgi:hypothetical protein